MDGKISRFLLTDNSYVITIASLLKDIFNYTKWCDIIKIFVWLINKNLVGYVCLPVVGKVG